MSSIPLRINRNRADIIGGLVVIVVMIGLFLPVVTVAVNTSADYFDHIRDARLWSEAGLGLDSAIRPHFFYHLLVIAAHNLLIGIDWSNAAVIVGVGLYVVLGVVVYALVRPVIIFSKSEWSVAGSVLVTLVLMLVAPVTIFTWGSQNLYLGYLGIHAYHNPTQVALKPFALLFFVYTLRIFTLDRPTIAAIIVTFALGIASTLSKPSFAICIIPAVGLFTLYRLIYRRPVQWRLLIFGFGASVAVVLAWQYLFHRIGEGGFGFAPFQVMDYYSPGTFPIKFVMSILFPVAVTVLYFKRARDDQALVLAWLTFAVAVAYTYLLIEPANWQSGNFGWSAEITLFILFVVATLFFMRGIVGVNIRVWGWRGYVCTAFLLLHLMSGLLWYVIQLTEGIYAWW